jgi:hypothetical protein
MTYAIVSCGACNRQRMIDRSSPSSKCPYCGAAAEHKGIAVIFENKDQNRVRSMLQRQHPFKEPEKKGKTVDHDPLSTLIYKYENNIDPQKRMELVSKGLTDIYGTFTLEDVEKVDEKNAERLLGAMLEQCFVHEIKHGKYRA